MKHKILIGDCRKALKTISPDSIHLIVTSPPYNVGIGYGNWNDSISFNDYLEFSREWLSECHRILTDDGRICVNIPTSTYKSNSVDLFRFHEVMREVGFKDRELIIWAKRRISDGRLCGKKIYGTWNPMNPLLRNPIEAILVMNKNRKRLSSFGKSDLTTKEFLRWNYTLWEIDTEADRSHPAPFPIELPRRLIKLFSFVGQNVLDVFLGSGTTMKACVELNRNSIGIELNPEYVKMAKKRIGYACVSVENISSKIDSLESCWDGEYIINGGMRYKLPSKMRIP
ncbi:site-specific DNA-methyltransferase [Candidatus Woesearchaeota archaeon]|nr:site-specific DNA-methyltransferase [Candidatus Woesearchaeota archaeon]